MRFDFRFSSLRPSKNAYDTFLQINNSFEMTENGIVKNWSTRAECQLREKWPERDIIPQERVVF